MITYLGISFGQDAYQKILQKINKAKNGTVYDFSVNYCSVEKEGILNIDEYFMLKNNLK